MTRSHWRTSAFWAATALATCTVSATAQTWPPDFVAENIGAGWVSPTCIAFGDAANMFVAEKGGRLWNVRNGVKRLTMVLDLSAEVLNNGDRGLLSVATDLEWNNNGWIYLLYIVDPNGDNNEAEQESFGRLTRYTTYKDQNGDLVADPASRLILIGPTWGEGIPSLHLSHSVGDLRFGVDGSLFISTGDGAHYDYTDVGGHDPNGFGPGKFDSSEDVGAFRSQLVTSLAGKILRVDPATGLGMPDNPFFTGNAMDNQSRVYAMGLRNPFRFTVRPNSGTPGRLYVGDVGWGTWEEINSALLGAENFGWPCWEGPRVESSYDAADPIMACNNASAFTKPLWFFNHSFPGNNGFTSQCIAGMQTYEGTNYPQQYSGRLFWCEYSSDWIRTVRFVNGQPTEVELFGNNIGNPVDLIADPATGDLIYVAIGDQAIRRVRYTKANHPPEVVASATPRWGAAPLSVTFDASGSSDPEGQPLSYLWEFGDGGTDTNAVTVHSYPTGLNYTAKLTVTDVGNETGTWSTLISVDNTPPVIQQILSPAAGSFFVDGQQITFDALVSDLEDNAAGGAPLVEWKFELVHDHHTHPSWDKLTGTPANWTAASEGPGTYFRVTLKVTDSRGLIASKIFDLYDLEAVPLPHLESVSDVAPRLGVEIEATGHLHYAGKGTADLIFDWGDGTGAIFHPAHLEQRRPTHRYSAPGIYTLRLFASDGTTRNVVSQTIQVRPLHPGVAIFAPLITQHLIPIADQWQIESDVANALRAEGFEAEIFGYGNQPALSTWLGNYLNDGIRDYLVCLDAGPSVVYSGQDDGSLAESWLDAGNGLLWTGFDPLRQYISPDGTDSDVGSGPYAADEVLDSAFPQVCVGNATLQLEPPASNLPALLPFTTSRGVIVQKLGSGWTADTVYADAGSGSTYITDAAVFRNAAGGEYAQFHCISGSNIPRAPVIRDFLLTHLLANRPPGPGTFNLLAPYQHAEGVPPLQVQFDWKASSGATSWLFELADDLEFIHPVHTQVVTGAPTLILDEVLRPINAYFWRVTARNDYGTAVSPIFGFKTGKANRKKK